MAVVSQGEITASPDEAISDIVPESTSDTPADESDDDSEIKQTWCKTMHSDVYRGKFCYTVCLFCAFFTLGCSVGEVGPALLDLELITNTSTKTASVFFTAGSVGYMVGSLLSSVLQDGISENLLISSILIGLSITELLVPFCTEYAAMIVIFFFKNIFGGGLDAAGNVSMLLVWGGSCRSYMQALHFCFGLGAVISPIYIQNFLAPLTKDLYNSSNLTMSSFHCIPSVSRPPEVVVNDSMRSLVGVTKLNYAFGITAVAAFLSAVPFAVAFCRKWSFHMVERGEEEEDNRQKLPRVHLFLVLGLVDLFYFMYSACEDCFGAFIAVFVVQQLCWTKTEGSIITSIFYGAIAAARFIGIFFTHYFHPGWFLGICSSLMVLNLAAFTVSGQYAFYEGIWIFAALTGTSMALIFPTGFLYAEEQLFKVTSKISASFLIASSMGSMISPSILGYLMDTYSNMWFSYFLLAQSVACVVVLIIIVAYDKTVLDKFKKPKLYKPIWEVQIVRAASTSCRY